MKRITVLLLALVLYGCNQSQPDEVLPKDESGKPITYVLSDRSHPEFEHVYHFQGESLVAQKHVFPGYAGRQVYLCKALPKDIHADLLRWVSHEGEITPPIEPGGVWYAIASFEDGNRTGTAYFKNENHDLARLFSELKENSMTESNEVKNLPKEVLDDVEVVAFFGGNN